MKEGWKDKLLHGKYPICASDPRVNSSLTHQWLAFITDFIIVAQDRSLPKRNFQANILEDGAEPKCRLCDKNTETTDYIVSSCPILAPTE